LKMFESTLAILGYVSLIIKGNYLFNLFVLPCQPLHIAEHIILLTSFPIHPRYIANKIGYQHLPIFQIMKFL